MKPKTDEYAPDETVQPEPDPYAALRRALEKRPRRMMRAPFRSRVLTEEEIYELLSFSLRR